MTEPAPTRDHTERALAAFGAQVDVVRPARSAIDGGQRCAARRLTSRATSRARRSGWRSPPGRPAATSTIEGVGLNPSRTAVLEMLRRAGARRDDATSRAAATAASRWAAFASRSTRPRSFAIAPARGAGHHRRDSRRSRRSRRMMPAGAELTVRGAAELRVKESDRITALGARPAARWAPTIEEFPDGFHLRRAAAGRRDGRRLRRSPAGDGVRHRRDAARAARRRSPALARWTSRTRFFDDARSAHAR